MLLLGLNSASITLVQRWMASGDVPHLRAPQQEGVRALLTSPLGLGDDATWASFATRTAPGSHGRYYFRLIQPASYDDHPVQNTHLKCEPFWNALGRLRNCAWRWLTFPRRR